VADTQKGFLPYRSFPPLKLNDKTAEVFYLAAKYNFDPQLIRRSPGSEYLSLSKHLSDGKRIYISKDIYNRQEQAAAMAYELGRLAHHDAEIELALSYIKQLISDIFMFYCITPEVYAAFGVGDEAIITAVAIRDAFFGSFSTLLRPFYNIFQQSRVYAADEFAVSTGYGESMVSLMMDLPINLTANKLFEMVFLSEPSKEKREAAIHQKMETQQSL
jgi:Zn-dependent protease with chaperone function